MRPDGVVPEVCLSLFSTDRETGYDGWLMVEAFGMLLPGIAAVATKIWRRMYESEEQLAHDAFGIFKAGAWPMIIRHRRCPLRRPSVAPWPGSLGLRPSCQQFSQRGRKLLLVFAAYVLAPLAHGEPAAPTSSPFIKHSLSTKFTSEGAAIIDANRDGHPDVVSGTWWYAGPTFERRHEYRPPQEFPIDQYSESFFSFAGDFNRDGWDDVLTIGMPGTAAVWHENPRGGTGHWPPHLVLEVVDNESPALAQVVGDERPELVCNHAGFVGYAEAHATNSQRPWRFTPISENRGYQRFTHGLGVGDLSGDGRADVVLREGWFEQPPQLDAGPHWVFHEFLFSEPGGAQMLIADFDGDGDQDLVTSKAAHAYGLAWFENVRTEGQVTFVEHRITGEKPSENEFGIAFSQAHGLALADMNRDGVPDFVTGKRWWAHSDKDPGSLEPAVLYWFRAERSASGFRFVPELVDDNSGVGTQVTVGHLNRDELPDILVGNKKGTFVFLQQVGQ